MTPFPVRSTQGKLVHFYAYGRSTACGQPVDIDRWTVRAQHLVRDTDWCGRCWNKVLG